MNIGEQLLILWATYWLSASLVGAFIGSSLALWVHRVIQRRKHARKND